MGDTETVLITGGTGFIGAHLAAQLLDRGHTVATFDLRTSSPLIDQLGIGARLQTIRGDVTDTTAVYRALEQTGATRVIHLASLLTDRSRNDPRAATDINVRATNTIFEAGRTFDDQVERIVWASSSAVYGGPGTYGEDLLTEEDLCAPETLYGATKAYNEAQADVYAADYGVSIVGLRPTLVYGPFRETGGGSTYTDVIAGPASRTPTEVGPAGRILDWQYVEDAAQAFRKAAVAPEGALSQSVYNVCGTRATLEEAAAIVRDCLPEAEITVTDDGSVPWTHTIDDSAARRDFGYDPEYDLEAGVRSYLDERRTDRPSGESCSTN